MNQNDKIYIAGHSGLVGGAVLRRLEQGGFHNLLTIPHGELDLRCQEAAARFFRENRPDYVFMCAARVGGIDANNRYMADFAMENAQITCNTLAAAHEVGVKKFLYMGSSCIYPRECGQPIREESLLTGLPEPTNEGFALAKLLGARMCAYYQRQFGERFLCCIPANTYGPRDHFDPAVGHVIPALFRRFDRAKRERAPAIDIWGSGKPLREFIYIDDLADGLVFLMEHCALPLINLGTGEQAAIGDLARMIGEIVGYGGEIRFDTSKPDGMMQRRLDTSKADALGWRSRIPLREGLERTYRWFLENETEG